MRNYCKGKFKGHWLTSLNKINFKLQLNRIQIEADPDILPRTDSFGLDYLEYVKLCPPNTPPGFLRLTFYCCIVSTYQTYYSNFK